MDSCKEFQQKIKNRKFAIDHSWRADENAGKQPEPAPQPQEVGSLQELPWEQLNENLKEADACKTFTGYWPLSSSRRIMGNWIVFLKKVIRKLLKIFMGWYIFPHYQRMSHFNGKVVNVISLERDILTATVHQTQAISQRLEGQEQRVSEKLAESGRQVSERLTEQDRQVSEKLAEQDRQISRRFEEQDRQFEEKINGQKEELAAGFTEIQSRLEAILSALRQQKAEADGQIRDLSGQIERLASENEQLRVRLKKIENLPTDDDEFYHQFEEKFRGSEDLIRDRLRVYVPVIQQYLPDWSKCRFVDVGSGRGEWLDILRENGAEDYVGVDLNGRQNALCEARGHKVVQMDCIQYLAAQPEHSVDLISGFQIIEHLCLSDLMELLRQSYRALKPGGVILFETPNPKNLMVGADSFYFDPSHKRPLDPSLTSFLVEWCGYSHVQCLDANSHPLSARIEIPEWNKSADKLHLVQEFNDLKWLMYGPQDYAVIGVKEKEK